MGVLAISVEFPLMVETEYMKVGPTGTRDVPSWLVYHDEDAKDGKSSEEAV